MGQIAFGELAGAAQQLGKRRAQAAQQQHHQRQRGEYRQHGMDLADAFEPAQQPRRVGIDPDHFGGLVGHADLDQLVELLVDAALEQIDQPLPGDVGAPAALQLLDLAELIQRVLELLPDPGQPLKLGRFGLALVGADEGELFLAELLERRQVGFDHLVEIGGAEGPLGRCRSGACRSRP